MSVDRYRSIDEVPPPPSSHDPATNLRKVLEASRLGVRLARTEAVRGVQRFATITEANAAPRRCPRSDPR